MKHFLFFTLIVFCSCTMKSDINEKLADDYRLYKETIAWGLAQAVDEEDTTKIRSLIVDEHIPVDFRDSKYKQTLLMLAVRTDKELSVKKLLELGANPNAHDDSVRYFGENPIIIASRFSRPSSRILELLLKYGGNPNSTACGVQENNLGEVVPIRMFALSRAVCNSLDKVKLLLDAGADINYSTSTEDCALETCMANDRMDIMLYLLRKGANYRQKFREIDMNSPSYATYNVDILYKLRECVYPLNTKEYRDKMMVVDFLGKKGLNYHKSKIPNDVYEVIKRKIAPKNGLELEKYLRCY